MASAWGDSWGAAWADAWGRSASVQNSGGYERTKKRKRYEWPADAFPLPWDADKRRADWDAKFLPALQTVAAQQISDGIDDSEAQDALAEELALRGLIDENQQYAEILRKVRQALLDDEEDVIIALLLH